MNVSLTILGSLVGARQRLYRETKMEIVHVTRTYGPASGVGIYSPIRKEGGGGRGRPRLEKK